MKYVFLPREKLWFSMTCDAISMIYNWYLDSIFFVALFFKLLNVNHYANYAIHLDNQDRRLRNNLLDHRQNNYLD